MYFRVKDKKGLSNKKVQSLINSETKKKRMIVTPKLNTSKFKNFFRKTLSKVL